jgi:hypothetical protein
MAFVAGRRRRRRRRETRGEAPAAAMADPKFEGCLCRSVVNTGQLLGSVCPLLITRLIGFVSL